MCVCVRARVCTSVCKSEAPLASAALRARNLVRVVEQPNKMLTNDSDDDGGRRRNNNNDHEDDYLPADLLNERLPVFPSSSAAGAA